MAYDVKVKIDLTKPVGNIGFGIPLVLVENMSGAAATNTEGDPYASYVQIPYAEVSSMDDVVKAGFDEGRPVYSAVQLMFAQKTPPKKVAVCGVSCAAADVLTKDSALVGKGWRQLVVINENDTSNVMQIAAAVEMLDGKMYFEGLDADDTTTLPGKNLRRTVLFYCTATEATPVPVAALVGAVAGKPVGSFTYKNLILSGIEPQNLTDAEIEAIHAKGGITFVAKAGDNVTSEGKTVVGEYIDIVDAEDYIIQQLAYKTQKLLNTSDKVPYDNNGIAMLETVALDVLAGAYNNGMIAVNADGTPAYSVNYALREDTLETDRANRKYMGGNFKFALAGAVHEAEIVGEITV